MQRNAIGRLSYRCGTFRVTTGLHVDLVLLLFCHQGPYSLRAPPSSPRPRLRSAERGIASLQFSTFSGAQKFGAEDLQVSSTPRSDNRFLALLQDTG